MITKQLNFVRTRKQSYWEKEGNKGMIDAIYIEEDVGNGCCSWSFRIREIRHEDGSSLLIEMPSHATDALLHPQIIKALSTLKKANTLDAAEKVLLKNRIIEVII